MQDAMQLCEISLVGGDTTRGPLSVTVQAMGWVPVGQALTRSGAGVGDAVYVTGYPGEASAGLRLIQSSGWAREDLLKPPFDQLIERFWRPCPRLREATLMAGLASSAIDVSDGLLADLGQLCDSSGVGAIIYREQLPTSDKLKGIAVEQALTYQLAGGDDYELCFTVPEAKCGALELRFADQGLTATRIGQVIEQAGVRCLDEAGREVELLEKGYEHFGG